MLHFPQYGAAAWAYNVLLGKDSTLPKAAHEVAILVTGARFHTRYELYAHEHVAFDAGLSAAKIATLVAGERSDRPGRPSGLKRSRLVAAACRFRSHADSDAPPGGQAAAETMRIVDRLSSVQLLPRSPPQQERAAA